MCLVFGVWCTAYTHTIHTALLKVLSQGEVCLIEVYTHYMRHRPLSNHSKLKFPSRGILYCPENITWPQNTLGLKEQQAELFVRVFKHPGVFLAALLSSLSAVFYYAKENSCRDSCPSHPSQRYIYHHIISTPSGNKQLWRSMQPWPPTVWFCSLLPSIHVVQCFASEPYTRKS